MNIWKKYELPTWNENQHEDKIISNQRQELIKWSEMKLSFYFTDILLKILSFEFFWLWPEDVVQFSWGRNMFRCRGRGGGGTY